MPSDPFLDRLLTLPRLRSCALSPDGLSAAWTWAGLAPSADIYTGPVSGSDDIIRLTDTGENSDLESWTADNSSVLVTEDRGGDERAQLLQISLESPLVLKSLTDPHPSYFLRGGQMHPNGRWLIYGMNFDVGTDQEIEPTWVYRHDLTTGERRPLARPLKPAYMSPQLNRAGTHVLYERQDLDPAGNQIWLVDIEGRNDREILNVGAAARIVASWFPDSLRVLILAECQTHRRLGVWDLETNSTRWILDDAVRNIESAWAPAGAERDLVVVVEVDAARTHATVLDVESGEETIIPQTSENLIPLRPVNGGEWVGEAYHSTQPDDLVRFRLDAPQIATSLTGLWSQTELTPDDLVPAEDFRWKSTDGLDIQGWLYRPGAAAKGTIIRVHGGPTAHSENAFDAQTQFFVHEGFNVLLPNYRGSTGFGLPFQEAIKEDGWGGREQDDIRSGIEALIASGIAQPGKVGITGTSYGGYSSWCAITRWPPEIIAAAAPICGMTDLVVDYETTRPDLRAYSEEMMGGTPEQRPERYRERSPIHFVDRIRAPLLIVQGARDPNVTPENVRTVREALDSAGIAYDVLQFEDEGHGIARLENQRVLYTRLVDFFEQSFQTS